MLPLAGAAGALDQLLRTLTSWWDDARRTRRPKDWADRLRRLTSDLFDPTDDAERATMLTNHTILVGYGRVGSLVGQTLRQARTPFLVVEDSDKTLAKIRAEGIAASGPYAPDTVFMRARHAPPMHLGEFDIVIAMTHDHGLIPVKYLGVEQGVNVTLGLPFVRTSPDHGTAFDIAGSGRADASSLAAAVRMAWRLAGVSASSAPP